MRRVTKEEVRSVLADLGISEGDILMVHAFVPAIGRIDGGLAALGEAFCEILGPSGTLIVPTFTYSFRRQEVFDVRNSPSIVGAFTEYVRRQSGAVRSTCPLFSMAALGGDAGRLMERRSERCFGSGSVYETLFENRVKFLGIGVDYSQGYTFFMHLERLAGIPHRREQVFEGLTRNAAGVLAADRAIHFVQVQDSPWRSNRDRLCRRLLSDGLIDEIEAGACAYRLFDTTRFPRAVLDALAEDPTCMIDPL